MRLDSYLAKYYPEYSRSMWQKYIAAGTVLVNQKKQISAKYLMKEDDEVSILEQPPPPKAADLPIIFEDENVLVVNKPTGILSHAKGGIIQESTVASWLLEHISNITRIIPVNINNREGIVHRLDRDTSGVMITAKNEPTAKLLGRQFTDRKVKKTYIAIAAGTLKHQQATIDVPIERNPKKPSQFRVGSNGKSAVTDYKVLAQKDNLTLLELKPETGRTHQLRVHLLYLKAPVLGDRIYGKQAERMFLHAHKLEITIPGSQRKVFSAPLPKEFSRYFPDISL